MAWSSRRIASVAAIAGLLGGTAITFWPPFDPLMQTWSAVRLQVGTSLAATGLAVWLVEVLLRSASTAEARLIARHQAMLPVGVLHKRATELASRSFSVLRECVTNYDDFAEDIIYNRTQASDSEGIEGLASFLLEAGYHFERYREIRSGVEFLQEAGKDVAPIAFHVGPLLESREVEPLSKMVNDEFSLRRVLGLWASEAQANATIPGEVVDTLFRYHLACERMAKHANGLQTRTAPKN